MATGEPSGVVTISISLWSAVSGCFKTTIENMEVPADTLPVPCLTLFVAVMPVPASPSGGQSIHPGFRIPEGSRSRAPSLVRYPESSPATRISGRSCLIFQLISEVVPDVGLFWLSVLLMRWSNVSSICLSYESVSESTGNMPDASPMPSTFLPVSFQCINPASVVIYAIRFTCSSLFNTA